MGLGMGVERQRNHVTSSLDILKGQSYLEKG